MHPLTHRLTHSPTHPPTAVLAIIPLQVDPFAKGDSLEGGIRYSELLRFCGRHAAQVGRDPRTGRALAGRSRKEALGVLRRALLAKVRPWCWIQDVRRLFTQFDEDQDGCLSSSEFAALLEQIGLADDGRTGHGDGFGANDRKHVMAALDRDGFGRVSYADFVKFLSETGVAETGFPGGTDGELAERFASALRRQAAPGQLASVLQEQFSRADRSGDGRLDKTQLLGILGQSLSGGGDPSLGGGGERMNGFGAEEAARLVGMLDEDRDGRVSYRELVTFMLQHLDRQRDKLPGILSALREQLRPLRSGRRGLLKRLNDLCDLSDSDRSGRLSPDDLRKTFGAVGLAMSGADVAVAVEALDAIGDGRVPFKVLIEELSRDPRADEDDGYGMGEEGTGALGGGRGGGGGGGTVAPPGMGKAADEVVLAKALGLLRKAVTESGVMSTNEFLQCLAYYDAEQSGTLTEGYLWAAVADVAPVRFCFCFRVRSRPRPPDDAGINSDAANFIAAPTLPTPSSPRSRSRSRHHHMCLAGPSIEPARQEGDP